MGASCFNERNEKFWHENQSTRRFRGTFSPIVGHPFLSGKKTMCSEPMARNSAASQSKWGSIRGPRKHGFSRLITHQRKEHRICSHFQSTGLAHEHGMDGPQIQHYRTLRGLCADFHQRRFWEPCELVTFSAFCRSINAPTRCGRSVPSRSGDTPSPNGLPKDHPSVKMRSNKEANNFLTRSSKAIRFSASGRKGPFSP